MSEPEPCDSPCDADVSLLLDALDRGGPLEAAAVAASAVVLGGTLVALWCWLFG